LLIDDDFSISFGVLPFNAKARKHIGKTAVINPHTKDFGVGVPHSPPYLPHATAACLLHKKRTGKSCRQAGIPRRTVHGDFIHKIATSCYNS